MCIHSSEDIAWNSKQQGLNLENAVELIFYPDYDGDISVTSLTVMCITDMTRKNSQLHSIKGCKRRHQKTTQTERVAQDYNNDESSESDYTTSTYISRYFGMEKRDKCTEDNIGSLVIN
jgi:hypothetical protein